MNLFIDFWEDLLWSIGTAFVLLVLLYILAIVISIAIGVLRIVSMWKLFGKAGEPGWSAVVPVYNYMQMIKIATGNFKLAWVYLGLYVLAVVVGIIWGITLSIVEMSNGSDSLMIMLSTLFMIIAIVGSVGYAAITLYISYLFPKSYGKSDVFCVLSIFFAPIMVIIMGFDKSTAYVGPKGIPQNNNYYYQNRF